MKYSVFGIALAALLVSSLPSSAAVNVRQINQERRIDAGHRSGKLTGSETRHLRG